MLLAQKQLLMQQLWAVVVVTLSGTTKKNKFESRYSSCKTLIEKNLFFIKYLFKSSRSQGLLLLFC